MKVSLSADKKKITIQDGFKSAGTSVITAYNAAPPTIDFELEGFVNPQTTQ